MPLVGSDQEKGRGGRPGVERGARSAYRPLASSFGLDDFSAANASSAVWDEIDSMYLAKGRLSVPGGARRILVLQR